MKVAKNDIVLIRSGNFKGKRGKVLKVFPDEQRVIVEGVNLVKRHMRRSQKNPQGGIIEKEAPVHVSNVQVICPKCGKPTRIGRKILENRKRVRVCKKCNEMIVSST